MFSVANRRTMLLMIGILAFALLCVMCRRTEGFMRRRSRWLSKGKKRKNTNDELTKEDKKQRLEDERLTKEDERLTLEDERLTKEDERLTLEDERLTKEDERLTKEDTQIKTQIGDLRRVDIDFEKQIKEKAERQTILDIKDRLTNLEANYNYNNS